MTISEIEGVSTVDIYDSRWMNDTRGFHVVESEANLYATFKVAVFGTEADGGEYRDALLDWLIGKGFVEASAEGADDVAVAAALQRTAANGRKVWECFMLGVDPTKADDDFKITRFWMEGGKPMFEFRHSTDGAGKSFVTRIKVKG